MAVTRAVVNPEQEARSRQSLRGTPASKGTFLRPVRPPQVSLNRLGFIVSSTLSVENQILPSNYDVKIGGEVMDENQ